MTTEQEVKPLTDDADAWIVLAAVETCANAWEPGARLLGNVRACDIARSVMRAAGELDDARAIISTLTAERDALREALKAAQATLAFYAHPTGNDVDGLPITVPAFYDELEFGDAAKQLLPQIKAVLSPGTDLGAALARLKQEGSSP